MKNVKQVLEKKGYAIHSVAPDDTVLDALREMANKEIGALLVLDGGELSGIVSERDYARKVVLKGRWSKDTPVREIMSEKVVCVDVTQRVNACMALMTEKRLRHLVVREGERLVGVISIGDIVKAIIDDQQFTIEQLEHYITGGR